MRARVEGSGEGEGDVCVPPFIASPSFCSFSVARNVRTGMGMQQSHSLGATKSIQSIVRKCEDLHFHLISGSSWCAVEFVAKT